MKGLLIAVASTVALSNTAFAQPSAREIVFASIAKTVRADIENASTALDAGEFDRATTHLRSASANANRLSLQAITEKVANATPSFRPENVNFALAQSSTIAFQDFIDLRDTAERVFKDDEGRVVTVRVFGEARDLSDFMFIKDDQAMIEKAGLEVAEMMGEPAIKRRGEKGDLSVLIMSKDDHALIEIEGKDEDAVMEFIGDMENGVKG